MQTTAAGLAVPEIAMRAASGAAPAARQAPATAQTGAVRPVVVSSRNGLRATETAMEMMKAGADTLDAVVAGVNIVESDPNDSSVGYGGLPNELGVVQLDSSVMHGPTNGAGAVAAIEGIMNPSKVAKLVMERTDHVLLVGQGAQDFAVMMGFKVENLLTDRARESWLRWKQNLSDRDDWIDPRERIPPDRRGSGQVRYPIPREVWRDDVVEVDGVLYTHGTINCNAVNERGEVSGVTTTSGLSYKIPGRVGDSPIIGAGLYVDGKVGACGSTGRGEANIKTCASMLAVEFMRNGDSPEEAGLKVCQRIAEFTTEPYLLDEQGRPNFGLNFYLCNVKGECAGVALMSGGRYSVNDGQTNQHRDMAYIYRRSDEPSSWI
jgi:N4-(beta-N-acetylglucosaminyl)-L-asparaginase